MTLLLCVLSADNVACSFPCFTTLLFLFRYSIGNQLRTGFFGQDASVQTDMSELPLVKRLSDETAELVKVDSDFDPIRVQDSRYRSSCCFTTEKTFNLPLDKHITFITLLSKATYNTVIILFYELQSTNSTNCQALLLPPKLPQISPHNVIL